MKHILLPSTDLAVSRYCLGTMYFGSKVSTQVSMDLLDLYADRGGNFLDSANKYASWIPGCIGGESEEVIGKWLKRGRVRDQYVLTSKLGFPYGEVPKGLRTKEIISECEKSLTRLGTDYIDLYFAHTQDEHTPIEETLHAFDSLIAAGKVRHIGASNYQAWRLSEADQAATAHCLPPFRAFQQRFTYLQPTLGADFGTQMILTPEQMDYCAQHGLLLMAYSPLLAGLYERPDAEIPIQYRSEHNDKLMHLLRERASEWGYTPSQLVLGWMNALRPSIVPVVTASRPEHLASNLNPVLEVHAVAFAAEVASVDSFTIKYS